MKTKDKRFTENKKFKQEKSNKKKVFKNRKLIFQMLNRKTFNWVNIIEAIDEKDLVYELTLYENAAIDNAEFRIIENSNNEEVVKEFLHGKRGIELYLDEKKNHTMDAYLMKNQDFKKKKKSKYDDIDLEIIQTLRKRTEDEEQEILDTVKSLVLVNYDV